jgi:hypothetical protein
VSDTDLNQHTFFIEAQTDCGFDIIEDGVPVALGANTCIYNSNCAGRNHYLLSNDA